MPRQIIRVESILVCKERLHNNNLAFQVLCHSLHGIGMDIQAIHSMMFTCESIFKLFISRPMLNKSITVSAIQLRYKNSISKSTQDTTNMSVCDI